MLTRQPACFSVLHLNLPRLRPFHKAQPEPLDAESSLKAIIFILPIPKLRNSFPTWFLESPIAKMPLAQLCPPHQSIMRARGNHGSSRRGLAKSRTIASSESFLAANQVGSPLASAAAA
ncbi:hypothetical protein Vafri_4204 [Volvox africanus]|uniref:Uncharacterized protein n=1 Tax=Volvox africanus TaxID=51714 RepID=A0A8J4EX39_9CHLO|nr:hypothetical protein Vafri_4204 [Volvox africanus]